MPQSLQSLLDALRQFGGTGGGGVRTPAPPPPLRSLDAILAEDETTQQRLAALRERQARNAPSAFDPLRDYLVGQPKGLSDLIVDHPETRLPGWRQDIQTIGKVFNYRPGHALYETLNTLAPGLGASVLSSLELAGGPGNIISAYMPHMSLGEATMALPPGLATRAVSVPFALVGAEQATRPGASTSERVMGAIQALLGSWGARGGGARGGGASRGASRGDALSDAVRRWLTDTKAVDPIERAASRAASRGAAGPAARPLSDLTRKRGVPGPSGSERYHGPDLLRPASGEPPPAGALEVGPAAPPPLAPRRGPDLRSASGAPPPEGALDIGPPIAPPPTPRRGPGLTAPSGAPPPEGIITTGLPQQTPPRGLENPIVKRILGGTYEENIRPRDPAMLGPEPTTALDVGDVPTQPRLPGTDPLELPSRTPTPPEIPIGAVDEQAMLEAAKARGVDVSELDPAQFTRYAPDDPRGYEFLPWRERRDLRGLDQRFRDLTEGDRGFSLPGILPFITRGAGGAGVGAPLGASMDPEHPVRGAVVGGTLGLLAMIFGPEVAKSLLSRAGRPEAAQAAQRATRSAGEETHFLGSTGESLKRRTDQIPFDIGRDPVAKHEPLWGALGDETGAVTVGDRVPPGELKNLLNQVGRGSETYRYNAMLSGPVTHGKNIEGGVGQVHLKALEELLSGRPGRAGDITSAFWNPQTIRDTRAAFRNPEIAGRAGERWGTGPTTFIKRALMAPDYAVQQALTRAGLSPEEARQIALVGDPKTAAGQLLNQFVQRVPGSKFFAPFPRIMTNLFEGGLEMTPGTRLFNTLLGGGARAADKTVGPGLRTSWAKQGIGAGLLAGGAAAGSPRDWFDEDDPLRYQKAGMVDALMATGALPWEIGAAMRPAFEDVQTPGQVPGAAANALVKGAEGAFEASPFSFKPWQVGQIPQQYVPQIIKQIVAAMGATPASEYETTHNPLAKVFAEIPILRDLLGIPLQGGRQERQSSRQASQERQ